MATAKKTVKKRKTSNPSTKRVKKEKAPPSLERTYVGVFGWQSMSKIDVRFKVQMAEDFVKWAYDENNDATDMESFFTRRGVRRHTRRKWQKDHPEFNELVELGKEILGASRSERMAKGQVDKSVIMWTQHDYSPAFDEANRYHADLKKSSNKVDVDAIRELRELFAPVPASKVFPVPERKDERRNED